MKLTKPRLTGWNGGSKEDKPGKVACGITIPALNSSGSGCRRSAQSACLSGAKRQPLRLQQRTPSGMSRGYQSIGNSVPPNLMRAIAEHVKGKLEALEAEKCRVK